MDIGRQPNTAARQEADEKHLAERVAETRKSAETIGGWCLGSIVAASLRSAGGPNRVALTLGVVGLILGLLGATTLWRPSTVDPAQLSKHLLRSYKVRFAIRTAAIVALLAALAALVVDAWSSTQVGASSSSNCFLDGRSLPHHTQLSLNVMRVYSARVNAQYLVSLSVNRV
jgi:hypothetical protein